MAMRDLMMELLAMSRQEDSCRRSGHRGRCGRPKETREPFGVETPFRTPAWVHPAKAAQTPAEYAPRVPDTSPGRCAWLAAHAITAEPA